MQARIRLREWESQNFRRLYFMQYRIRKIGTWFFIVIFEKLQMLAFLLWLALKLVFTLVRIFFIGPRLVRYIEPGQPPQESFEFQNQHGGGLWK